MFLCDHRWPVISSLTTCSQDTFSATRYCFCALWLHYLNPPSPFQPAAKSAHFVMYLLNVFLACLRTDGRLCKDMENPDYFLSQLSSESSSEVKDFGQCCALWPIKETIHFWDLQPVSGPSLNKLCGQMKGKFVVMLLTILLWWSGSKHSSLVTENRQWSSKVSVNPKPRIIFFSHLYMKYALHETKHEFCDEQSKGCLLN